MRNLLIALALLTLAACSGPAEPEHKTLVRAWAVTACADGDEQYMACPYSYVKLYHDGTYAAAALRGYVTGTWKQDEKNNMIGLYPGADAPADEKGNAYWEIKQFTARELSIALHTTLLFSASTPDAYITFKATESGPESDPFLPANNRWRIKPAQPETKEKIQERVRQFLQFQQKFYQYAADNQIAKPETDWFPQPMMLNNDRVIRMAYSNELSSWEKCFYNWDQASEGYQVISGPFVKTELKPGKTKPVRNIAFLQEILSRIDSANLKAAP